MEEMIKHSKSQKIKIFFDFCKKRVSFNDYQCPLKFSCTPTTSSTTFAPTSLIPTTLSTTAVTTLSTTTLAKSSTTQTSLTTDDTTIASSDPTTKMENSSVMLSKNVSLNFFVINNFS